MTWLQRFTSMSFMSYGNSSRDQRRRGCNTKRGMPLHYQVLPEAGTTSSTSYTRLQHSGHAYSPLRYNTIGAEAVE